MTELEAYMSKEALRKEEEFWGAYRKRGVCVCVYVCWKEALRKEEEFCGAYRKRGVIIHDVC
jgi:hypothetical protein